MTPPNMTLIELKERIDSAEKRLNDLRREYLIAYTGYNVGDIVPCKEKKYKLIGVAIAFHKTAVFQGQLVKKDGTLSETVHILYGNDLIAAQEITK